MARALAALVVLAAFLGGSAGLETHSAIALRVATRVKSRASLWGEDADTVPNDKIVRVIKMLENLIAEMDAEQASDDQQFAEFTKWCTEQQAATQASIDTLTMEIETLTAALAELYSQKEELEADIKRLKGEIATTRNQIQQAKQKRAEEKESFGKEQQDFDSSIAACNKAIEILKAHYGDGTEEKAEKPAWMSLVQVVQTVRRAVSRHKVDVSNDMQSLLEQPTEFNRYQGKTGEALNIVDQMKMLADTFADDKQSAIDEENRLQKLFTSLMKEKTELLNSLIAERDSQQAVLDKVNQVIAEKETAKAHAEEELADEQAYLAQTKKTCDDTSALFAMRKKDREAEKLAVSEAVKVLGGGAGEGLLQITGGSRQGLALLQVSTGRARTRLFSRSCPRCRQAANMLQEAARATKSAILATAATATMGSEAVQDVIAALEEMISRIEEDGKMEKEHKDWCVDEITETTNKETTHTGNVEDLTAEINDETEVIAEKTEGIEETASEDESVQGRHPGHGQVNGEGDKRDTADMDVLDRNFEEATVFRAKEKAAFEKEQADYVEALAALNQAIDILAKFYASKKGASLAQLEAASEIAPRAVAPGVFDDVYESKGGKGVIEMISTVRTEFELGKKDLEAAEAKAVEDYNKVKDAYQKTLSDLVGKLNLLITERQTSRNAKDQATEDREEEKGEVKAAQDYLLQLQGSCQTLLNKYTERVAMRTEEKAAIKKAIKVLEEES